MNTSIRDIGISTMAHNVLNHVKEMNHFTPTDVNRRSVNKLEYSDNKCCNQWLNFQSFAPGNSIGIWRRKHRTHISLRHRLSSINWLSAVRKYRPRVKLNRRPRATRRSIVSCYTVSQKRHWFGLLCLRHSSTNCNIFVDNKVVLLSTVRKYYFSPSPFVF